MLTKKDPLFQHTDVYWDILTFNSRTIPPKVVDSLAHALIDWAKTSKDDYTMEDFYEKYNFHRKHFTDLCKKYPKLQTAKEFAMMCLGSRREKGGLKKELDSHIVRQSMHIYNEDWANSARFWNGLAIEKAVAVKQQTDNTNQTMSYGAISLLLDGETIKVD